MLLLALAAAFALVPSAAAETASSTCGTPGDDVRWTLDADGVLTVAGSGAMRDYERSDPAPWGNGVRRVVIEEGVTSVGAMAFMECGSLTAARLPAGLTSIGSAAFGWCPALEEIGFPESLTEIGSQAFYACGGLTELVLPAGLRTIEYEAFSCCGGLTELVLPEGLVGIGLGAFSNCPSLAEVSFPAGLESIGAYAFNGDGLRAAELPEGLTELGDCAFSDCGALTKAVLPATLTTVGDNPFSGCKKLRKIDLAEENEALEIIDGVLYSRADARLIGVPCAFKLEEHVVPEGTRTIGGFAFYNYQTLGTITLPDSVTEIGRLAFSGAYGLTTTPVLPEGLTKIGEMAFCNCIDLSAMTLPEGLAEIGDRAFEDCEELTLTVTAGSYAEQYCRDNGLKFSH